jgi:DNA-binding SARP family transcriptional activator/DNA-binding beta-propeller fold protein YncE
LPLGGPKQRAVLTLLLLHANEVLPVDRLIDELWGVDPPNSAANMLQGYVSHLRRELEPDNARGEHDLLVSQPPGYVLRIRRGQLDAERFTDLADEGRALMADGDPAAAAKRLRAALALWRGPALADFAYEEFARPDAERLEELRLAALEDRIDADLALGRHDVLVAELRGLVADYPLRERLRGQIMAALYRCGRQAEALEIYRDGRRALQRELGLEPGPALRALEQAILRQDPELGSTTLPPRPFLRHLRRRRLLIAGAALLAGVALIGVLAFGHDGSSKEVIVRPNSIAVIDPARNTVVDDVPVGLYPGPLASDDSYVYSGNIGSATITRIDAHTRQSGDPFSLSRAIDLVAPRHHLWSANGGVAGHTPFPPGTVTDLDLFTFAVRTITVGPDVEAFGGNEASTTIASSSDGTHIWVGNKESRSLKEIDPQTHAIVGKIAGVMPGAVAVVQDARGGETVWASDQTGDVVLRIDGRTRRITRRIPVVGQPARLAADRRAVWVITRGTRALDQWQLTRETTPAVWRIDSKTESPIEKIRLPLTPIRIALGAGSVWVTALRVLTTQGETTEATVLRIDPSTDRIIARIRLGADAVDGIVVSHGLVWVAVPPSQ